MLKMAGLQTRVGDVETDPLLRGQTAKRCRHCRCGFGETGNRFVLCEMAVGEGAPSEVLAECREVHCVGQFATACHFPAPQIVLGLVDEMTDHVLDCPAVDICG
jgi:hypothetical protein